MRYILFAVSLFFGLGAFAQSYRPTIVQSPLPGHTTNISCQYYNVPEFYLISAKKHNDTTLEFLCYDVRDSLIPHVKNFEDVRYYSLFKSYTDSGHTYKDSNGKKQLLPVSSIIRRYDKVGKDKWMSVDYSNNKYVTLKEFPQDIVRADTIEIMDPVSGDEIVQFYKYYKVEAVK